MKEGAMASNVMLLLLGIHLVCCTETNPVGCGAAREKVVLKYFLCSCNGEIQLGRSGYLLDFDRSLGIGDKPVNLKDVLEIVDEDTYPFDLMMCFDVLEVISKDNVEEITVPASKYANEGIIPFIQFMYILRPNETAKCIFWDWILPENRGNIAKNNEAYEDLFTCIFSALLTYKDINHIFPVYHLIKRMKIAERMVISLIERDIARAQGKMVFVEEYECAQSPEFFVK